MVRLRAALLALGAIASFPASAAQADAVRPLGEALYTAGIGRDGREIVGRMNGELLLRGAAAACSNCHGTDARGGGEGFVRVPDIRWYALSKPYGAIRGDGEVRPGYDAAAFARAVRTGLGAGDVLLDPAMPRFDLADDEIAALIARLDASTATLPPASPTLVFLLPQTAEPMAERLREGLQTCPHPRPPEGTKSGAGQRLPAVRVVRYENAAKAAMEVKALEQRGEVAALLAPYLIGREQAFADALGAAPTPVLFPVTLFDAEWRAPARFALPGLEAQSLALLESVEDQRRGHPGAPLVIRSDVGHPDAIALAGRVATAAASRGWQPRLWSGAELFPGAALALLALAPLPPASPDRSTAQGSPALVLVPSAFMEADHAATWAALGATVRVALPYPPSPTGAKQWTPPALAWTAIGCELMAQLPRIPKSRDGLSGWRARLADLSQLTLDPWMRLPATATTAAAARRVMLIDWRPGVAAAR